MPNCSRTGQKHQAVRCPSKSLKRLLTYYANPKISTYLSTGLACWDAAQCHCSILWQWKRRPLGISWCIERTWWYFLPSTQGSLRWNLWAHLPWAQTWNAKRDKPMLPVLCPVYFRLRWVGACIICHIEGLFGRASVSANCCVTIVSKPVMKPVEDMWSRTLTVNGFSKAFSMTGRSRMQWVLLYHVVSFWPEDLLKTCSFCLDLLFLKQFETCLFQATDWATLRLQKTSSKQSQSCSHSFLVQFVLLSGRADGLDWETLLRSCPLCPFQVKIFTKLKRIDACSSV